MIAELMIILDLLKRRADTPSSTPTPTGPTRAKTVTPGSKASLGGALNFVGPIKTITQPVIGVGLTPKEASKTYLQGGTGKPESIATKLRTGRL